MNNKEMKNLIKKARELAKPFRVTDDRFRLKGVDPSATPQFASEDKPREKDALAMGGTLMAELQDRLYAQDRWAILLMFQGVDAAGKDSAIKQVMSGLNPQGCQVFSFKSPTTEELNHDYLWRCLQRLPERGRIGIFNRSYYEETLVVRVHPEILANQRLPPALVTKDIWKERFQDIRGFERYLARNGVAILKFFLHISKEEQKKRFLERIEEPEKNWKFSEDDVKEREHWKVMLRQPGPYLRYQPCISEATAVETLQSHHQPAFDEPTTGAIAGDAFYALGTTQVARLNEKGEIEAPETLKTPKVVRMSLRKTAPRMAN